MKRYAPALAAALMSLSAYAQACDPRTEVAVDLQDEPARRIFEELSKREGWTLSNADVLEGRTLTAQFKACTMRETFERLSASLGLALSVEGPKLTLLAAQPEQD
jgi:hypothetical protein